MATAQRSQASGAHTAGPVRLTRRGRAVVVLALTGGLLGGAASVASASFAGADRGAPGTPQLRHVIVRPGDTLWGIAAKAAPGADPRATVQRIVDLNGLRDTTVEPGQQLVLPAS
jgi:nucleoid-associated protein YgaU